MDPFCGQECTLIAGLKSHLGKPCHSFCILADLCSKRVKMDGTRIVSVADFSSAIQAHLQFVLDHNSVFMSALILQDTDTASLSIQDMIHAQLATTVWSPIMLECLVCVPVVASQRKWLTSLLLLFSAALDNEFVLAQSNKGSPIHHLLRDAGMAGHITSIRCEPLEDLETQRILLQHVIRIVDVLDMDPCQHWLADWMGHILSQDHPLRHLAFDQLALVFKALKHRHAMMLNKIVFKTGVDTDQTIAGALRTIEENLDMIVDSDHNFKALPLASQGPELFQSTSAMCRSEFLRLQARCLLKPDFEECRNLRKTAAGLFEPASAIELLASNEKVVAMEAARILSACISAPSPYTTNNMTVMATVMEGSHLPVDILFWLLYLCSSSMDPGFSSDCIIRLFLATLDQDSINWELGVTYLVSLKRLGRIPLQLEEKLASIVMSKVADEGSSNLDAICSRLFDKPAVQFITSHLAFAFYEHLSNGDLPLLDTFIRKIKESPASFVVTHAADIVVGILSGTDSNLLDDKVRILISLIAEDKDQLGADMVRGTWRKLIATCRQALVNRFSLRLGELQQAASEKAKWALTCVMKESSSGGKSVPLSDFLKSYVLGVFHYFTAETLLLPESTTERKETAIRALGRLLQLLGAHSNTIMAQIINVFDVGRSQGVKRDVLIEAWGQFLKALDISKVGDAIVILVAELYSFVIEDPDSEKGINPFLDYLIVQHRASASSYFERLFFVRSCSPKASNLLEASRSRPAVERLQRCIQMLDDDHALVIELTLKEIREIVTTNYDMVNGWMSRDSVDFIANNLISKVLHICSRFASHGNDQNSINHRIQLECARCIGALGALDCDRVGEIITKKNSTASDVPIEYNLNSEMTIVNTLMQIVLTSLLPGFRAAKDARSQGRYTYGIQMALQNCHIDKLLTPTASKENLPPANQSHVSTLDLAKSIWGSLDKSTQEALTPFAFARYKIVVPESWDNFAPPLFSHFPSHQEWLGHWLHQIIYGLPETLKRYFIPFVPLFRGSTTDVSIASKMMPIFLAYVFLHGTEEGCKSVIEEFRCVLSADCRRDPVAIQVRPKNIVAGFICVDCI